MSITSSADRRTPGWATLLYTGLRNNNLLNDESNPISVKTMTKGDMLYKREIVYMDPNDLIPYEYNPREHNDEIEIITNSIKKFKFPPSKAIEVNEDLVILNGHGRRLAAIKAGLKEVPVLIRDDLTEEEQMAWRIVDNQTSDLSGWNIELLDQQKELLSASGWDLESFGLSLPEDYGWGDDEGDEEETETIAPTVAEESHKLIMFCETQEEEDDVMAFALSKGITCQLMR